MGHQPLPSRMSLPEIMGDPCASELREHALALLRATESADKLIRSHPDVECDLVGLRDGVERFTAAVLETLAAEAGIPPESESISSHGTPMGDYRIDRSSGCWIWMRSVTARGYPIVGRKANGREIVPAKIYWMLAHGPLGEHEIVVRTCKSRLCVNPDHGRVTDRREYGAERMRESSVLDWDAVRAIRRTLRGSRDDLRGRAAALARRFGVGEHSILDVFRNKVWFDPEYVPGFEVICAAPGCSVVFRTTSTVRKYHSADCYAGAIAARAATTRRSLTDAGLSSISRERRAREEARLRAEVAAAEGKWSDVLADGPRTSVWAVVSIDQPLGDGIGALHEVLASPRADDDPAEQLEHNALREVLDGLTEEAVAAMGDAELEPIRARLVAADIRPSTSRALGH